MRLFRGVCGGGLWSRTEPQESQCQDCLEGRGRESPKRGGLSWGGSWENPSVSCWCWRPPTLGCWGEWEEAFWRKEVAGLDGCRRRRQKLLPPVPGTVLWACDKDASILSLGNSSDNPNKNRIKNFSEENPGLQGELLRKCLLLNSSLLRALCQNLLDFLMQVISINAQSNPRKEILALSHPTDEEARHTEVKSFPSKAGCNPQSIWAWNLPT